MSTVLELREKRATAWDKAKAFLDDKRKLSADGLTITAEDEVVYNKMEAEVDALKNEITRQEKRDALDRELGEPTKPPIKNDPDTSGQTVQKSSRATNAYKQAFWNALRGRRAAYNDLQIGDDSKGGYTVPDEFEKTLIEALGEENLFRQLCNVIQTSSGDTKIPVVATKGIAYWVDEGGLIPESDDTFAQVSLNAHKVATRIKVSEELMNDSVFNLEQYIAREFARRIGVKEEEAFAVGDGRGNP